MENKENEIVVKYSPTRLLLPSIVGLGMIFLGIGMLNIYFTKNDGGALLGGLVLMTLGVVNGIWSLIMLRKQVILVINDKGIDFVRDNIDVNWNEIDFLSFDVQVVRGKTTYEKVKFSCFLLNGYENTANLTAADQKWQELYIAIKQQYPQVKCYPPEGQSVWKDGNDNSKEDNNETQVSENPTTNSTDSNNSANSTSTFIMPQNATQEANTDISNGDNINDQYSEDEEESETGFLKSLKTKKFWLKALREACYCIGAAYIIFCLIAYFNGLTFGRGFSLDFRLFIGSASIGGIALFLLKDKVKVFKSRIMLFGIVTMVVFLTTVFTFDELTIYDVTSYDNRYKVDRLSSFGNANVCDIHLSAKEGRTFIVNSTDDNIYLLGREYTVIETTSQRRGKRGTEYTYTGRAYDRDIKSLGEHDYLLDTIQPHAYLPLQLNDWNVMSTKIGIPSNEYKITSRYEGVEKIYLYFIGFLPRGFDPMNNGDVKEHNDVENNASRHPSQTKTRIREDYRWKK